MRKQIAVMYGGNYERMGNMEWWGTLNDVQQMMVVFAGVCLVSIVVGITVATSTGSKL
jgi:flagellar biosynthesis/type III secretory pathway M-ring protein FliF/YscJ